MTEAADRVAEGADDVELPIFGRDEFGDLAAKFNSVVDTRRQQEADLRAAEAETDEILMAVMPSRLVDQVKRGDRDIAETLSNATLVAFHIGEPGVSDPLEQENLADHAVAVSAGIIELAGSHGAQLLRSSATEHLYATGLESEDEQTEQAITFAAAVRDWIAQTAETTGLGFEFRGGLAAGDVLVGIVGSERIAFAVWGAPPRRAAELAAVAAPGQILVDPNIAGRIGHEWLVEPLVDLVDLSGDGLDGWRLVGARTG